jgi:hypothetical protein
MTKEQLEHQLKLAKRALSLADNIMAYCGGDLWERECTEKDRNRYKALYKTVTGKESEA